MRTYKFEVEKGGGRGFYYACERVEEAVTVATSSIVFPFFRQQPPIHQYAIVPRWKHVLNFAAYAHNEL